ncbi:DUF4236 domain-containing protein [Synechococcus sp. A10-1-5-9]|uniref:DUF4236 domain-containing protein n=1 Tax=Synechococcus sp. A10-1-5-9 TaxID=3392295 RepID=UPI0039E9701A
MNFRFRRRIKFGPFALNLSKNGLSSLSIGGPGATVNVPIARQGGTRTTVGLPGTGLSWSEEQKPQRSVRERQQAQRPAPAVTSTEQIIADTMAALVGHDRPGDALWRQGLVQKVIDHDDTPRRIREAAFLIRSPEAVELHLRRAKGAAATRRASLQIIRAVQDVV